MHFIQKYILDELRKHDDIRYAVLQPDGIESSHFRYHLKELERDGYVTSPDRGRYKLTSKGQHFVDRLSRGSVNAVNMPKVITYTLLTHGDTYVLQSKDKEPYKNLLNMIGGKVHEGETTAAASCREVQEKTGLIVKSPTLKGVFEVLIRHEGAVLTHAIAYTYRAELSDVLPSELHAIPKSDLPHMTGLAPDALSVITAIETQKCPATMTFEIDT